MTTTRIMLPAALVLPMVALGCAHSTTHVRQEDGTVRTTSRLIWRLPSSQDRTFTSDEDYTVISEFHGVRYEWPKGTGFLKSLDEMYFRGDAIRCKVVKRELLVDDRSFGEFEPGDCVRIAADGRVFVNGKRRSSIGSG